jgi:hypothetical protein
MHCSLSALNNGMVFLFVADEPNEPANWENGL